jgi:hypothetical protein
MSGCAISQLARLQQTSFRASSKLIQSLRKRHLKEEKPERE